MTIIEHYDTEDEAKARAGKLIGTLEGPNPVYGLQTTDVLVARGVGRWNVEIQTKLVAILRDPDGIPKEELDSAYQKVMEENAVLRRTNADATLGDQMGCRIHRASSSDCRRGSVRRYLV